MPQVRGAFTDYFVIAHSALISAWFYGLIVAWVFRMPMRKRKAIEGVMTRKINRAFIEVDKKMGLTYAFGYFFALPIYLVMTCVVLFFNWFYPRWYTIDWAWCLVFLYFMDLVLYTVGLAGLQFINTLVASKAGCWKIVWVTFSVIRYFKNMRG